MALVPMRDASSSSRGILTVLLEANRSFEKKTRSTLLVFSDSLMQVYYPSVCMFGCITEANKLIRSRVLIFLRDSYIPWKSAPE